MKSEIPMTNDERSPNAEAQSLAGATLRKNPVGILDFGVHSSFVIRHSSF